MPLLATYGHLLRTSVVDFVFNHFCLETVIIKAKFKALMEPDNAN